MSTMLTINVTNEENVAQNFFFFQQPAIYSGGETVYTNSLFEAPLGPSDTTGGQLMFQANLQFYAGIQQSLALTPPEVGEVSGSSSASQAIDLATSSGSATKDTTTMTLAPLSLSVPTFNTGVQPGAFRIITAGWNTESQTYNAGSATLVNGSIVLSNFIKASPLTNVDAQPILKYYVATGNYTAGTVMNFSESSVSAALCDFTSGHTVANVTYKNDGTWSVTYI